MKKPRSRSPTPRRFFSRLLRDWRGERHEVHVVENGFIWRGKTRRSLSAIASEIAGGRRNGPAFFGLRNGNAVR